LSNINYNYIKPYASSIASALIFSLAKLALLSSSFIRSMLNPIQLKVEKAFVPWSLLKSAYHVSSKTSN